MTNKARARRTDPETSHEAARTVTDIRCSQSEVLRVFDAYGEMTDEQLLDSYSSTSSHEQSPSGLRTRRSELVKMGYLKDSGERATMSTGRQAIVWRTTSARERVAFFLSEAKDG